jgi:hypothetical protein
MNYWLRLYTGILDDPKVQWLTPEQFKGWINILCLAKENDGLLPSTKVVAFRLRISEVEANCLVEALTSAGLLDHSNEGITPHNWEGRQFISDEDPTAAIRARRYRQKQSVTDSVTRDVTGPSLLPETEYRAETETESEQRASRVKPRSARRPTACDDEFLVELQQNPAYQVFDVKTIYYRMVAWCQQKGKQPTRARLVNWLNREDRPMTAPTPQNGGNNGRTIGARKETLGERNAREYEELIRLSAAAYAASNADIGADTENTVPEGLSIDIGGY